MKVTCMIFSAKVHPTSADVPLTAVFDYSLIKFFQQLISLFVY